MGIVGNFGQNFIKLHSNPFNVLSYSYLFHSQPNVWGAKRDLKIPFTPYGIAQPLIRSSMGMIYWLSSIDTNLKNLMIWSGWCCWWRRGWILICCLWCGGWFGVIGMILGAEIIVWRLEVSEIKHTPFCRIFYWFRKIGVHHLQSRTDQSDGVLLLNRITK